MQRDLSTPVVHRHREGLRQRLQKQGRIATREFDKGRLVEVKARRPGDVRMGFDPLVKVDDRCLHAPGGQLQRQLHGVVVADHGRLRRVRGAAAAVAFRGPCPLSVAPSCSKALARSPWRPAGTMAS